MKRINTSTRALNLFGAGKDGFTDGNPGTGTPATQLEAQFFNDLQEELVGIIEAAGITPTTGVTTQVLTALRSIFRKKLTANTTFYVSTSGNDSTGDGSSGTPWATIQKAWNVISQTYDLNGYIATIQLADGTYTSGLSAYGNPVGWTGVGSLVIKGNTSTPANVYLNPSSGETIAAVGAGLTVKDLKLSAAASANGLSASDGGQIFYSNINFAASSGTHITAYQGGRIAAAGNYTISGGAVSHANVAGSGGRIDMGGVTVTLSGTPAFSSAFAYCAYQGMIYAPSTTFSGSATGARYRSDILGVISSLGAGASYFPGSVAGSVTNGGLYL